MPSISHANAASDTLAITATVDPSTAGLTIINTAAVSAVNELDGNPANDSDSASLTVMSADLGMTKTVDDDAPYECRHCGEPTFVSAVPYRSVGNPSERA